MPLFSHTTANGVNIRQLLSGRCNVFAVSAEKQIVVIDTSTQKYEEALSACLDELLKGEPYSISCILTHSHFDHAMNARYLQETYGAPIYCHDLELPLLAKGENPPIVGTGPVLGVLTKVLQKPLKAAGAYPAVVDPLSIETVRDSLAKDFNIEILHTPGHTDGSISVVVDGEVALVGDAMIGREPHTIFPPFGSNRDLILKSWRTLIKTPCTTFFPSHGKLISASLLREQLDKHLLVLSD